MPKFLSDIQDADRINDSSSTKKLVTQVEKNTWNSKSNLALGETSGTAYRGDRGKASYDHSLVAHAPSGAQVNQTLTSGNGMAAWTATNGNLTIALGAPSTLTSSTTNATTATSHTHAVTFPVTSVNGLTGAVALTHLDVGAASEMHGHSKSSILDLGNISGIDLSNDTSQYLRGDGSWTTISGIVESGSNTNGHYTKYSDGTMVCYHRVNSVVSLSPSAFSSFFRAFYTWTFPEPFISPVRAEIMGTIMLNDVVTNTSMFSDGDGSTTQGLFVFLGSATYNQLRRPYLKAIGRWK